MRWRWRWQWHVLPLSLLAVWIVATAGATVNEPLAAEMPAPKAGEAKAGEIAAPAIGQPASPQMNSATTKAPVVPNRAAVRLQSARGRGGRLTFDFDSPTNYTVVRDGPRVSILFDGVSEIDVSRLRGGASQGVGGVSVERGSRRTAFVMTIPKGADLNDRHDGNRVIIDVGPTPAKSAGPAPAKGKQGKRRAGQPPPPVAVTPPISAPISGDAAAASIPVVPPADIASKPATPLTSEVQPLSAGNAPGPAAETAATMRFAWPRPAAAAIFTRPGAMWMVFDLPSAQDVENLRLAAGPAVHAVRQIPHPRATILRLAVEDDYAPEITREGTTWLVTLRRRALTATAAIVPQISAGEGHLDLPVAEPGEPLAISDPEIGDAIIVVPTLPLGAGVPHRFRYPQFELLPSAQGIAIRPLIDTLMVRTSRENVTLSASEGLRLSPVSDVARAAAEVPAVEAAERTLALDQIKETTPAQFGDRQRQLQDAVLAATPAEREVARLELARFYLANHFAAEALGVITLIVNDRPAAENEPAIRLLRGASRMLLGRYGEARDDLAHDSLAGKPEAALWRAVGDSRSGQAPGELADFAQLRALAQSYPPPLREPLLTGLAEAGIAAGRDKETAALLPLLRGTARTPADLAWLDYLDGRLNENADDKAGALAAYDRAASGESRLGRIKAAAAAARLRLASGDIGSDQAIEAYDQLRFTWRGDGTEFEILRELGRLQAKAGDYPAALRNWRQAVALYRGRPEAVALTREMAASFETLFSGGGIDKLPPVKALALYSEFKELIPPAERGNELERKVAEMNLAADLPEPAITLMHSQLQRSPPAPARAAAGAILAEAYLRDGKSGDALDALTKTESPGLAQELEQRRRRTHSEALARAGRHDEALAAITRDAGGESLRARILRQKQDWAGLGLASERLIRELGATPGAALTGPQAAGVLDRAVALTLASDKPGLDELTKQYGAAMARSAYRDTFAVLTNVRIDGMGNARDAAASVETIAGFRRSLHGDPPPPPPAR